MKHFHECKKVQIKRSLARGLLLVAAGPFFGLSVQAANLNEWTFETDAVGKTLSQAINSTGSANFSAGDETGLATDGVSKLRCTHDDAGSTTGMWTNGAILNTAPSFSSTSAVQYLRYDLSYDLSLTNNDSGSVVGFAFYDGASNKVVGVALESRVDTSEPPTYTVTEVALLPDDVATITVILKVDLTNQTVAVWYDLGGSTAGFSPSSPHFGKSVSISSVSALRFQATGDIRPAGSGDFIDINNVRMADTWDDIVAPIPDYSSGPAIEIVSVTVTNSSGNAGSSFGETNAVNVIIRNQGAPASNVVTAVSAATHPEYFSITPGSIELTDLAYAQVVTNTFFLVAGTNTQNGEYEFNVSVADDGGIYDNTNLFRKFGESISYDSHTFTNDTGGVLSGQIEPSETFELTVVSINDGGVPVSGITNSLVPENTAVFPSVSNLTPAVYGTLNVGDTTSTTYRITCSSSATNGVYLFSVINRTASQAWTNQLQLTVVRQGILSVSTNALTILVAPGEVNSATVTLSNTGNAGTPFRVEYDSRVPVTYAVVTQSQTRVAFKNPDFFPNTVFTNWSGAATASMAIGFNFPALGGIYSTFSVSTNGVMTLGSTNDAAAKIMPFQTSTGVALPTVRYQKEANRLVVAWGNDGVENNGTEFQVWLHKDGTVEYLYEYGTWTTNGAIALGSQPISHVPGSTGRDSLLLTPTPWISCNPAVGTLAGPGSSQLLTLTAAAPGWQPTSTNVFTAIVTGEETSASITVTVVVQQPIVQLDVPAVFTFTGTAGSISPAAHLIVTNSGNVSLTYTITDTGAQSAGYTIESVDYQWRYIPVNADTVVDEADLDTAPVDIGFPFFVDGDTYTNLIISVDRLILGTTPIIPFTADLSMDDDSSIRVLRDAGSTRLTVTWENLTASGGSNQTFQVILYRDGKISYNYQLLEGDGLTYNGDLITQTVYTIGNVSFVADGPLTTGGITGETNAVTMLSRASLLVAPAQPRIITFSPVSGTIAAGTTADIVLRGDARSLTAGAPFNSVTNSTGLTFAYGTTNTATGTVNFIATNSVETAFSALADPVVQAAMWGTDGAAVVSSTLNTDGSRTLSWPAANDTLSRTYTVWFTTSLSSPWEWLATVPNDTRYVDNSHNTAPVIFYKVTVE